MAYTRNWGSSDPTDATLVIDVDNEINEKGIDLQERLDRVLTIGAGNSPPATLSNGSPGDTRFATNVDPVWIRGDRVDLRKCTYRSAAPVVPVASVTSTDIVFAAVTGHQIIITPVSADSVIELVAELLIQQRATTAYKSNANMRGETQWYDTTAVGVVGPTLTTIVGDGQASVGEGGSFYIVTLRARVTGITGAHTFDLRFRVVNTANSNAIFIRADLQNSYLYYIEHV